MDTKAESGAESEQVSSLNYLQDTIPSPSKYLFPMFEKFIQTLDWSMSLHFKKSMTY